MHSPYNIDYSKSRRVRYIVSDIGYLTFLVYFWKRNKTKLLQATRTSSLLCSKVIYVKCFGEAAE